MDTEFLEIVGNGKLTGSVLMETLCSFRHDINKRAQNDTAESFSELFYAAECEKCIENPKSQRKKSQWKNVAMALQGLLQINLRQFIL